MESPWKFCPHCGVAIAVEVQLEIPKQPEPEEHEKSSLPGAFTGLLFGMLAVPILAIVGTMLCLTGLGAILGIPMILAAILAPLLGPMVGLGALKGKCPWCAIQVSSVANKKDFNCHGCGQRIAIRHREFVKAG
jgi:DNA-directed RNA polymerase subunit RPC12/RpoP